jgi:glucose/arabinose dehydrogenase
MCRISYPFRQIGFSLILSLLAAFSLQCARQPEANQPRRTGQPIRREADTSPIDAKSLPEPFETSSVSFPPRLIEPPVGAKLKLPPDFRINIFTNDLNSPSCIAIAPNGDIFVTQSRAGNVVVLRDADQDGVAELREVFAAGLELPYGIAFHNNFLYIANTGTIVRFPYSAGQIKAAGPAERLFEIPRLGNNWWRSLIFTPDGSKMIVGIGSETNVSEESDMWRASLLESDPDGKNRTIYASGIRASGGFAFYPGSNTLWTTCDERDDMGDDLPPDYFTSVKRKGFYGWPYAYIGPNPEPRLEGKGMDMVRETILPDILITAHSGIKSAVFYTGNQFPQEYQNNAFISLHGSWNRSLRTGYKIIRVRFKDGRPVGGPEDFISGWMLDETRMEVWGMPMGLAVATDGSLLIADDAGNRIWRFYYSKKR